VLAAARYGLDTVILPRRNDSDLEELPESVRSTMKFVLVDTVDQVLEAALLSPEDMQAADNRHPPKKAARTPRRRAPISP
jgi:ATP-dependent Lon protease